MAFNFEFPWHERDHWKQVNVIFETNDRDGEWRAHAQEETKQPIQFDSIQFHQSIRLDIKQLRMQDSIESLTNSSVNDQRGDAV